jgi:acetolactate synthase-1/2/3 large subunit
VEVERAKQKGEMHMKLSDYVVEFILEKGILDVFLLPGGGMMHLLDSLARYNEIRKYCNLHEQASAISAEGYAAYSGNPGVVFLTTGPGALNAVTSVANAFVDSTPMFIVSGQVKTADLMTGKGVRQIGAQEINIVDIVRPITKYAATVIDPAQIRQHLEQAWYLAVTGRKGPVWIDIPLDIQAARISPEDMIGFTSPFVPKFEDTISISKIYNLLNRAQRPAVLVGHGVAAAGVQRQLLELLDIWQIPALSSWRVRDLLSGHYPLFFGCPGVLASRYANLITQNCDFMLILGTRLNYAMTAFNEPSFAPKAKKVIVDIDENELALLHGDYDMRLKADVGELIVALLHDKEMYKKTNLTPWIAYCRQMRDAFPLENEKQPRPTHDVDGYRLGFELTHRLTQNDVLVSSSSGRASAIAPMSLGLGRKNRFITAMGLGSMGYALPLSIGVCIASNRARTICIEGDGSLQHNLQELQLITTYRLPIKLFILNNNGYASIRNMQRGHFDSRFLFCDPNSGLSLPSLQGIATLYGIPYYKIEDSSKIDEVLDRIMADDTPCLCEVMMDADFDEIPRASTKLDEEGKPYSAPLDDLYPFLTEEAKRKTEWNDPVFE